MIDAMPDKVTLRANLRALRREHEAALQQGTRALLFLRPPSWLAERVPEGATVGLYHSVGAEAPTLGYARWFSEHGRHVALPWFATRGALMAYRLWTDPWDDELLAVGPFGAPQPKAGAPAAVPGLAIVPLVAFDAAGYRLGQGGGHYDRWHAAHPGVPAIGLAWDCQRVERLPAEPHDHPLAAVITPTRLYEFGAADAH